MTLSVDQVGAPAHGPSGRYLAVEQGIVSETAALPSSSTRRTAGTADPERRTVDRPQRMSRSGQQDIACQSITRLALVDGVVVHLEGGLLITDLPLGVQRFVALLGLAGRPGRSTVAGYLWPEVPEEVAQRSLRTTLWRVQRCLPGLVDSSGGALAVSSRVSVDVHELTDWACSAIDPHTPVDECIRPGCWFYGDLLPGWYEDWVLLERERLHQLCMHALETLSAKLTRAGRYGEAVDAAHEAIRLGPLRESAHRALIQAHAEEGNTGEALLAYERFTDQLAEELGLAPSVQIEALVRELTYARTIRRPAASPRG
ncbi:AfsR/SARP family transcriptional regulator [Leekyejoonella antrihumi]|nr:BTAD domain-containing putative transcriptional regulator [Leekyejoonella antrihumi]